MDEFIPRLAWERADQPEVVALVEALDAWQRPLYPPESHHGLDIAALSQPQVLFCVAREPGGEAVGIGAVVLAPGEGEIKRMFVPAAWRGRGVARRVLTWLEQGARERGCEVLRLETGVLQHEAIRLYERSGYRRRPPFGTYVEDPHSLFMEKRLCRPGGT